MGLDFLLDAETFLSSLRSVSSRLPDISSYNKLHAIHGGAESSRTQQYMSMVNFYYDVTLAFYEIAWGTSFHFAGRHHGETFRESIKRHEHYVALQLGLKKGMKVLDVGCGIGGPMREIASFSGAYITGLNNNEMQINRGMVLNERYGLSHLCDFLKADFMEIPMPDNYYDAIYNLEACVHAPDLVALFKELYRVLKPGQLLMGMDWCMTQNYDPQCPQHNAIKEEIEYGNALTNIRTTVEYLQALKDAGFQVIREADNGEGMHVPWYEALNPNKFSIANFLTSAIGRYIGRKLLWCLELTHVVPKGSYDVNHLLEHSGHGLFLGGRLKIFTPNYFYLVQKPYC